MTDFMIRDYQGEDAEAVNTVCFQAFEELSSYYSGWKDLAVFLKQSSSVSQLGEMIVAEKEGRVLGVVTHVGPGRAKSDYFDQDWAIMRMLAVHPDARGLGMAKALVHECLERAKRDQAKIYALHTTPIMKAALTLYQGLGFSYLKPADPVFGVDYNVYIKEM